MQDEDNDADAEAERKRLHDAEITNEVRKHLTNILIEVTDRLFGE